MSKRGGSLILPWPNTPANIRKIMRELRAGGWLAERQRAEHRTYVWTNKIIATGSP